MTPRAGDSLQTLLARELLQSLIFSLPITYQVIFILSTSLS
ncbi:MAG: hypothetical protein OFPI_14700 [Osedax symbiont Rs2]|nr:MAG: hypothetical protein OFPI_14700 [Osedax symbiont Rs2]